MLKGKGTVDEVTSILNSWKYFAVTYQGQFHKIKKIENGQQYLCSGGFAK